MTDGRFITVIVNHNTVHHATIFFGFFSRSFASAGRMLSKIARKRHIHLIELERILLAFSIRHLEAIAI